MSHGTLRERVLIHIAEALHLGSTDEEGRARTGVDSYEQRRIELTDVAVPLLFHAGDRDGLQIWKLTLAGHTAVFAIKREAIWVSHGDPYNRGAES